MTHPDIGLAFLFVQFAAIIVLCVANHHLEADRDFWRKDRGSILSDSYKLWKENQELVLLLRKFRDAADEIETRRNENR